MGVMMAEMPDPEGIEPGVAAVGCARGAIVFISSETQRTTKDTALLRSQFPVVRVLGGQMAPTDIDHITPDNNAIGWLASQYLLDLGIRKLAFLTTQPGWDFAKLRAQGFIAGAERAGLTPTMYLQQPATAPAGMYGAKVVADPDLERLIGRMAEEKGEKGEKLGLFIFRDAGRRVSRVYPVAAHSHGRGSRARM